MSAAASGPSYVQNSGRLPAVRSRGAPPKGHGFAPSTHPRFQAVVHYPADGSDLLSFYSTLLSRLRLSFCPSLSAPGQLGLLINCSRDKLAENVIARFPFLKLEIAGTNIKIPTSSTHKYTHSQRKRRGQKSPPCLSHSASRPWRSMSRGAETPAQTPGIGKCLSTP